jgi:hypothetical protein
MMLSGRPLLATAADRRFLVPRIETDAVFRHAQAGMNTLVLAERGMGKTTLLRDLAARLESQDDGPTAVYLDGRRLTTSFLEIMAAVRDAVSGPRSGLSDVVHRAQPLLSEMPVEMRADETLRIIRELASRDQTRRAFVLLDDPHPDRAHQLFGRLRDELWQTGIVWIVAGDVARRQQYLTPPADAFFERIVELAPLDQAQQLELVQRRLEQGDGSGLMGMTVDSGNPRALLAALRDAIGAGLDVQTVLARRAQREARASRLGSLESMMLAEIEDGATASASDTEWLERFGVSRQRAQQALARLEREMLVTAERLPGPSGRPRKVYRRTEAAS